MSLPRVSCSLLAPRDSARNGARGSISRLRLCRLKTCLADRRAIADDFQARSSDELSLAKGDRVKLIERDDEFGDGWFLGQHMVSGNTGLFPEGSLHSCLNFSLHRRS